MIPVSDLHGLQYARDLIHAGLRQSIVRGLTLLGTRGLRQWWKDIHGVKPSNGKLPETVLSFIKDRDAAARLSAFGAMYRRLHGSELTADSLLVTWREFQHICGPLDINAAYFAARDIKARIVMLAHCGVCNANFIYDSGSRFTDNCPFCATRVVA